MLTFSQLSRSIEIIPHPDQMRSNALSAIPGDRFVDTWSLCTASSGLCALDMMVIHQLMYLRIPNLQTPSLVILEVYRHHRHSSNASEASSKAPFSDPAPSCDEIPNGGSPYVEEPLPMEGDFASMDLRSSPASITRCNIIIPNLAKRRCSRRADYIPKHLLVSQLQQQNSPQPQLCDYNNQADLGNYIPATEQQQFSCPDVRQAPAIMLSPNNPTSPSLRLDMNHPDMIQGPRDFQKVLEDMVNSKEPSVSALTSNRPVGDQRTEDGLFNSTLFGSNNTNFLNPRPVRGRQRSKKFAFLPGEPFGLLQLIQHLVFQFWHS
ncbi:hypothetical protein BY996DRAFT_6534508 [Phakopsora pachyrhizi]|nr:hypothetical protein BY996DRAFT_6534508 [Phakopsora pachyrhizi]